MPELRDGRLYVAPGDEVTLWKKEYADGEDETFMVVEVREDGTIPGITEVTEGILDVTMFCPLSGDLIPTAPDYDGAPDSPYFRRYYIHNPEQCLEAIRRASELAGKMKRNYFPVSDAELDHWLKQGLRCRASYDA